MADPKWYVLVFKGEGWNILREVGTTTLDGEEIDDRIYIASHVACPMAEDSPKYQGGKRHQGGIVKDADGLHLGVMSWFYDEGEAICYYCVTPVPDEIQALVHLAGSF